jgi:hypothetical protein
LTGSADSGTTWSTHPPDAPQITEDAVREDAVKAAAMVDLSERILDQMSPF